MKEFRFPGAATAIGRSAGEGVAAAGRAFAAKLREAGANATHATELDGSATIALEGANAVAREFGSLSSPAKPVLSPVLRARREDIARTVGRSLTKAISGKQA